MEAIQTHNLCKRYGTKDVVKNLNIVVPQGAIYGFIGRNGAGKSTTQKMVSGLVNASGGEIKLFDKAIDDTDVRMHIGTLIEEPGFYPGLSVKRNMILHAICMGIKHPKEKALEAIQAVDLEKAIHKKAKHLSLGMKQRLALAIALLGEPKLLILDEPINGLDPEGIVKVREVIEKLNREKGVTIFISSHMLGELSKIATHYGIIKDGQLVEQVTKEELAKKQKKYTTIKVKHANDTMEMLKQAFHFEQYEVVSDEELHIMDEVDSKKIHHFLYEKDCDVMEVFQHQQDLDEYFVQLMGGSEA